MNKFDDNDIKTSVKKVFGVDYLNDNTEEMGCVRLEILKDRKFCVPEWFHDYIRPDDMLDIINEVLASNMVDDNVKTFVSIQDKRGNIKDYEHVADIMVVMNDFSLVGYINPLKMYYALKKKTDLLSDESIISCIENICSVTKSLPVEYIYLYLSTMVSKHWYFSKRAKLYDVLVDLIKRVSYDNLNYVYSTIYTSKIVDMEKSDIPYHKFIDTYMGTWYKYKHSFDDVTG